MKSVYLCVSVSLSLSFPPSSPQQLRNCAASYYLRSCVFILKYPLSFVPRELIEKNSNNPFYVKLLTVQTVIH